MPKAALSRAYINKLPVMITDEILRDRCRGSLVGGAAGDALGYPVEFDRYDSILARYGARGITGYDLSSP